MTQRMRKPRPRNGTREWHLWRRDVMIGVAREWMYRYAESPLPGYREQAVVRVRWARAHNRVALDIRRGKGVRR